AIDEIWNELAGGPGKTLVLHLKERTTEIPLFRNGVARAQFWDLCGKPLGPADYLALSDAVRVLILENVPRLGRTNYNEAKRFVMLIDTLYEANVRLVVSAADVPERLYLEGTGAFEFERTASRLQEMQSKDWANQR
ncbi:MAG: AFG1/ZapE family ATPase, partial [Paracoccaceae bacterium]